VILDEATAALDTVTEKNIQEALTTLGNNRTVLVIAHHLTTIKQADNIIVLENGKIAESGTHHELLDKGGIYANMWSQNEDSPSAVGASDLSARERK
jgi:ABC-type multidrug transport system fused ATPase/permease subunit